MNCWGLRMRSMLQVPENKHGLQSAAWEEPKLCVRDLFLSLTLTSRRLFASSLKRVPSSLKVALRLRRLPEVAAAHASFC